LEASLSDLEQMAQRQAIRELIGRYYFGIDRKDRELICSCFSDDAVYEFVLEERTVRGREELLKTFGGSGGAKLSSHAISSQEIVVDGLEATADTMVVAHLVEGMAGPGRIFIRGLRYLDRLVLQPAGWRIVHRRHNSLWQYEADAVSPDLRGRIPGFQAALSKDLRAT
jgi:ketosteroid isomerase-like protein